MVRVGKLDKHTLRKEYEKIAEDFDRTRYKEWKEVSEFLKDVGVQETILDAGCGNGRHFKVLENRCKLTVGLDFSRKLLKLAKKKVYSKFVCGDVSNLPFKDGLFDRVLLIATLHHIPSKEMQVKTLKEIRRVLGNNGKLLLSVWSRKAGKFKNIDARIKDAIVTWGGKAEIYYHIFDIDEIKQVAEMAGFNNIFVWESGTNIWLKAEK
jgi:ubiquinone/menaquinone biosynthesis C-methylase UbiE